MTKRFEEKLNGCIERAKNLGDDFFDLHSAKLYGLTEKSLDKNMEEAGLVKVSMNVWDCEKGYCKKTCYKF